MTVLLEAPGVALAMSPEHGATITSLRDTFAHREWLEQPRAGLADFSPAVSFDEGDLCGWDEMMPTIDACRDPGTTIELAEHGDLWRTPWTLEEMSARSVTTSVSGTSPFSLSRTVEVSAQRVDLHYSLQTRGAAALHLLYAAHPLFGYLPGTRVVLDAGPHGLVGLRDDDTSPMRWPVGGLDLVDAVAPGTSRKLFLDPSARLSTVRLIDETGTSLAVSGQSTSWRTSACGSTTDTSRRTRSSRSSRPTDWATRCSAASSARRLPRHRVTPLARGPSQSNGPIGRSWDSAARTTKREGR